MFLDHVGLDASHCSSRSEKRSMAMVSIITVRRTVEAHLRSIFAKLGLTADENGNQRVLAAVGWLTEFRPSD